MVGGLSIEEQSFIQSQGVEVMVATPGRLNDALDRRYIVLNQCTYVVLDEADRMIDLGFEPQVKAVLDAMPSSNLKPEDEEALIDLAAARSRYRQTYMFSATMPPAIERIAKAYLRNPAYVYIGDQSSSKENIAQHVVDAQGGAEEGEAHRAPHVGPAAARHRLLQQQEGVRHPREVTRPAGLPDGDHPLGQGPGDARARASRPSSRARRRSSSRPTSPAAASTCRASSTSSTTTCPRTSRRTRTGSAGPAAPGARAWRRPLSRARASRRMACCTT